MVSSIAMIADMRRCEIITPCLPAGTTPLKTSCESEDRVKAGKQTMTGQKQKYKIQFVDWRNSGTDFRVCLKTLSNFRFVMINIIIGNYYVWN